MSSHSASKAAFVSAAGQRVTPHVHGIHVQSDLLQGGTVTALLELVASISHVQSCVRRMHQLMHSQQRLLQQMLRHRHQIEAQVATTHRSLAVKAEAVSQQQHRVKVDSAEPSVKLEEQSFEGFQPEHDAQLAGAAPIKSEDAEAANRTGDARPAASGRRRPPQRLAWHVVSSGVVQIACVGLDHAVLEVRPPPWSRAKSSIKPKLEDGATNTAKADLNFDTDMPDAEQPSSSVHHAAPQSQPESDHKLQDTMTPPVPLLTVCMQWKLAAAHSPDEDDQPEPTLSSVSTNAAPRQSHKLADSQERPASQGLLASQGQPASKRPPPSREMSSSQRLPPLHPQQSSPGVGVDDATKHDLHATQSGGQGIPKLKCCVQSEPELPCQLLECFQDMAGELSRVFNDH